MISLSSTYQVYGLSYTRVPLPYPSRSLQMNHLLTGTEEKGVGYVTWRETLRRPACAVIFVTVEHPSPVISFAATHGIPDRYHTANET